MATITQPKRHTFPHRNRSGSQLSSTRSFSAPSEHLLVKEYPRVFQGTDVVPQNQRVALQRVLDTHQALELKYDHEQQVSTPTSTTSERPMSSSSSILSSSITTADPFTLDFSSLGVPNAEVRAFRYLLRLWDSKSYPADADFDAAVAPVKTQFEERALKHFINRVTLWHTSSSDDSSSSMSRTIFAFRRRTRSRAKSVTQSLHESAGAMPAGGEEKDGLKEVTTREGLAQLVWTLLHDPRVSSASGLRERCTGALKEMYRMTSTTP